MKRTHPSGPAMSEVQSECYRCFRRIVFGDYGLLDKPTGWVWATEPGSHLQPLCAHCKSVTAKKLA